jgi:TonB-linked SusC/RagA family outer membrane protein
MLWLTPLTLSAQNITVNGNVTDAQGEPIIGASVVVVGLSSAGTVTDPDGNFTLSVPSGSKLLVSYLGMIAREVQATSRTTMKILLEEDSQSLDEVVVIGYGYVKRKDLTGAVSSVGENVLKNIPMTSTASAMTGRLAGVSVVTTEGSPDARVNIRIRGGGSISQDNSPLFIVDGFQVSNIDDIPPGDIESIDVLKDASSTAIYGAKGANGVVLVTTKGGKGGRTAVTFNSSVGFNKMYNETPVLSPYEYVYLQRELDLADNAGFFTRYGRWEDIDIYKSKSGNNWQKKLFDRTGIKQNYNLNITGSEQSLLYSVSYTRDDEGYILNSAINSENNCIFASKTT